MDAGDRLRLDKWLFFARLVKSRTLAQGLIAAGHVRINREKTDNPAKAIRVGDVLTLVLGRTVRVIEIRALGTRRGPAPEAQALYRDLAAPGGAPAAPDGVA